MTVDEAIAAAEKIGYPVAIKIVAEQISAQIRCRWSATKPA